jgi:hypothetical protein
VGANPTRRPLQPEATGATVEATKWLKPSVKRVTTYGDSASLQAVTQVNAEQASKRRCAGRPDCHTGEGWHDWVIVGPTRDRDLAKRNLEHLLRIRAHEESGWDAEVPEVLVSRVPLR